MLWCVMVVQLNPTEEMLSITNTISLNNWLAALDIQDWFLFMLLLIMVYYHSWVRKWYSKGNAG